MVVLEEFELTPFINLAKEIFEHVDIKKDIY